MQRREFIKQTSGSAMLASLVPANLLFDHVLPENVRIDLPLAVQQIRDAGLEVSMITTGITDPDDPMTLDILETAGNFIGSSGWDLREVISELDPKWTGIQ